MQIGSVRVEQRREREIESAALKRAPQLPGTMQIGLIVVLLGAAAIAWAVTGDRMQDMDAGPGSDLGALGWFVGIWVVMMAAMMFPAISPMVMMYARVNEGRRARGKEVQAGATAFFVAGYVLAWGAAGLAGYGIFELGRALDLGFLAWDEGGRYVAAAVIAAAAVYQLTPLKDVCLRKCRDPFNFVLHAWRPGRAGALRMGAEHGGWCIGCCWALMAALFALGVMSLAWMAVIAAFIAIEKLAPSKTLANRGVAVGLLVLAIGVLAVPDDVPGLTVPGSPEAGAAMESMGMESMETEPREAAPMGMEPGEGAPMEMSP